MSQITIQNEVRRLEEEGRLTDEIKQLLASIDFHVEDYFNKVGKVKRPMNCFFIYAQHRRAELAEIEEYKGFTTGKISQILKFEWNNSVSEAEKRRCQEKADKVKQVHKILFPDYMYKRRPNHWKETQRKGKLTKRTRRGEVAGSEPPGVPQQQENYVQGADGYYQQLDNSVYGSALWNPWTMYPNPQTQFQIQGFMPRAPEPYCDYSQIALDPNFAPPFARPETSQVQEYPTALTTQPQIKNFREEFDPNFEPPFARSETSQVQEYSTALTTQPQMQNFGEEFFKREPTPYSFILPPPAPTPEPSIAPSEPQQNPMVFPPPPVTADAYSASALASLFNDLIQ